MVKVKVKKFKTGGGNRRPRSVIVKRDAAGRIKDIYTIEMRSPTFDDDLTYIYRTNVASARRENKRLFGSVDGLKRPRHRMKISGSKNAASRT